MGPKPMEVSVKLQPTRQNSKITLSWKDISVWATKKKNGGFWTSQQYEHIRILNKVSGYVTSGSLMAIMGASGAGKTTLMATISQRVKGTDTVGEVLVNGKIISKDMMSRLSGFVPQNELITKTLTVQEHMKFMARLMMDTRVTETQRNRRISSLLSELGLAKCAYTTLGELSGGELKRVSLAVQLLTDPVLLFCDEPTTGLDSYNAGIVVESLRSFASRGKAVICTIHQPASGLFDLFHEVLLLAGGRVAFHGNVSEATSFFESLELRCPVGYNQAEFYVSQLGVVVDDEQRSLEKVQRICDQFAESRYGEVLRQHVFDGAEETAESHSRRSSRDDEDLLKSNKEFQKYSNIQKVNWGVQLYWLVWRSSIDMKRSKQDALIRFTLYMFIALLLALPYIHIADGVDQQNIQNVEGLMYLIITETVFTFAYAVFHTFPEEIPQLLREIGNGLYKPSPYYVGKILLSIPGAIIMPLAYTTLIFWIVGLQGGFFGYLLFCIPVIACAIASTAYGYAMSAVFESVATAALVSVPIDFVCIVFSGIYINLSNLPLHLTWLRYISPFYYGTEAISILQWSNVDEIKCNAAANLPCIRTGQQVLDKYGFDSNGFYFDLLGLACYYVVLQVVGYIGFWRRSRKESIY